MKDNDKNERQRYINHLLRESYAAISLGWELALPIFGGVLLGQFLDRIIGSTYVFTIGLLLFGIGSGYYNLFKAIQRLKEKPRKHYYIEYVEDEKEEAEEEK